MVAGFEHPSIFLSPDLEVDKLELGGPGGQTFFPRNRNQVNRLGLGFSVTIL